MAMIGDGEGKPYWSVIPPYVPVWPTVYVPTVWLPDTITSDETYTTWAETRVENPATKIARAFEARKMGQIMRRQYKRIRGPGF